jgi:hypothetical protein
VSPQRVEVRAQLADGPLGGSIVQVHVRHSRQVNLGAFDLADGCPEDLALLACGSLCRQLQNGIAHESKLGRQV